MHDYILFKKNIRFAFSLGKGHKSCNLEDIMTEIHITSNEWFIIGYMKTSCKLKGTFHQGHE